MNTKYVMIAAACMTGIIGALLLFLPEEIANFFHLPEMTAGSLLFIQVTGALYFGFAILNWLAKANLIGGIYSRPVAAGNFVHFIIGGLSLGKGYMSTGEPVILVAAAIYSVFAILFGYVIFTHPGKTQPVS
jgi:Na+-driven multidrug efflux pump